MEAIPGRISNLRLCAVSGFAALSALIGGFAIADIAQAPEASTQLAEIIVTAQYREEKLQDPPIAISAFTAAAIEQQGASKLSDIFNSAPSGLLRPHSPALRASASASI